MKKYYYVVSTIKYQTELVSDCGQVTVSCHFVVITFCKRVMFWPQLVGMSAGLLNQLSMNFQDFLELDTGRCCAGKQFNQF